MNCPVKSLVLSGALIASMMPLPFCYSKEESDSKPEDFCKEGLVLWLDASDPSTIVNDADGLVSLWKDKSGSSHNAVGSEAISRPKLVGGAANGRNALRFSGAQHLEIPQVIRKSTGEVAVFVVSQRLPEQASDCKWQRLLSSWDGKAVCDYKRPNFALSLMGNVGSGEAYVPTVWDLFEEDVLIGPLAIGSNLSSKRGDFFNGDIMEILVFDRGFVAEDPIQSVLKYLSSKWGAKIAREAEGWTRVGVLGETPVRKNETCPLSDQDNKAGWFRFDPMWDEFKGTKLDTDKWWPFNPDWKGRQPALFRESNVEIRDGKLNLTMRCEDVKDAPKDYNTFTSAAFQRTATSNTVRCGGMNRSCIFAPIGTGAQESWSRSRPSAIAMLWSFSSQAVPWAGVKRKRASHGICTLRQANLRPSAKGPDAWWPRISYAPPELRQVCGSKTAGRRTSVKKGSSSTSHVRSWTRMASSPRWRTTWSKSKPLDRLRFVRWTTEIPSTPRLSRASSGAGRFTESAWPLWRLVLS